MGGIFSFFGLKLWLGYGVQGARHKWTPIPIPLFFFVFNLGIKKIGVGSRVILWTENLINSFIHSHIPSFVTQSSVITPLYPLSTFSNSTKINLFVTLKDTGREETLDSKFYWYPKFYKHIFNSLAWNKSWLNSTKIKFPNFSKNIFKL